MRKNAHSKILKWEPKEQYLWDQLKNAKHGKLCTQMHALENHFTSHNNIIENK